MKGLKLQHLPYMPFRLTSPFIPRDSPSKRTGLPVGATTYHDGIDCGRDRRKYPDAYGNQSAGDVFSVLPGIVVESAYHKGRGHTVLIDHGRIDGRKVLTLYQHLAGSGKSEGTRVASGDVIGQMGRTGMGADMAIHLHFELRINGVCVDPLPYIRELEKRLAAQKVALSPQGQKLAIETQKELRLMKDSLDFLSSHHLPEELFRKILAGEDLSDETSKWILTYKHGEALFQRIEEYKQKVKGAKND